MAIGIFCVLGCLALVVLRYVKSNAQQPVRRSGTGALVAANPSTKDSTKI